MKKILLIFSVLLFSVATEVSYAQVAKNSWSFGFGLTYPRFQSTDVRPQQENYGGFLSLQRNFSEHVGLRLLVGYDHMKGRIGGFDPLMNRFYYTNGTVVPSMKEFMTSDVVSGNFDLLYYFIPCSPVSPYAGVGLGAAYLSPSWPSNVVNNVKSTASQQFNFVLGSEWKMSTNWNLKTEFGYHTTNGELDGITNTGRSGIFGSEADGYITFNVGFQYYFKKGEPSHFCDLYNGIEVQAPKENYPTLEQIEGLIEKYIPKEVVKEVVVKKTVAAAEKNWILYGVNFEFNKSSLLPEAYPIMQHAVSILKENSDLKVEIQGYTDNIGSKEYNLKLSQKRAQTVKDYLVKNGIEGSRLTTVGFGESNPVGDNGTIIGRAENRRIEFNVTK